MRIGIFAQAAGTTPRAVRHYHRLGLIPDPARTPSGYRDYSMSDVVRLMKVRRLAESGVPLGSIAAMIVEDSRSDVVDDINDLLSGIEREQKMLETKKSRLLGLLVDAREGRPLTALPRHLADRLTQLIEQNDWWPCTWAALPRSTLLDGPILSSSNSTTSFRIRLNGPSYSELPAL